VASAVGATLVDEDDLSTALWVGAAIFGVTGGLVLALPGDTETLPEKYQAMPSKTADELSDRVSYGENTIRQLADEAENQRKIGGGVSIALGVAFIALGDSNEGDRTVGGENFNLYTGILVAGSGIVQFFVKSKPEKEYAAYRDWLSGSGKSNASYNPYTLALGATPDGGMMGVSYRF
jgi:hypothetical protein